jgi:uncharacterized phage-associated protein
MTAWKLEKLAYYAQAWSLVWDEHRLFPDRVEAWANGPVVPNLYNYHRGQFQVSTVGGDADRLNDTQIETIDAVLKRYGSKSAQWLRDLTHREPPWKDARRVARLSETERGDAEITPGAMLDYYGSL